MAVHAVAVAVEQDRSDVSAGNAAVDGSAHSRWHRHEDDLAAFADHAQYAVPVFFDEVTDVQADRFEDPQAEQPKQADQGEVVTVGRVARGGQHGLELQVSQPQRR